MSTEVLTSVPGNIWKVLVEVGDEVSEGDVLFIMEVMKILHILTVITLLSIINIII